MKNLVKTFSNNITVTNSQITTKDVETALNKVLPSFDIFNHSHTQYTWKAQNLSHHGTSRNMRQVTAELNRKRQALSESKYKFLKKKVKLEKKIKDNSNDDLVILEVQELEEQLEFLRVSYEGCMKDVMYLTELHEQLKSKLIKDYGEYNEKTLELDEKKYWVKRMFAQSLRDIRQSGTISAGNQESLEQININPSYVLSICKEYLQYELDSVKSGNTCNNLNVFLEESSDLLSNNGEELFIKKGLTTEINEKLLNISE